MQVKLTTNLGTRDAERLGISPLKYYYCFEGAEISVSEETAEFLFRHGWAVHVEEDVEDPSEGDETEIILNAIPPEDLQAIPPKRRRGGRRPRNAD